MVNELLISLFRRRVPFTSHSSFILLRVAFRPNAMLLKNPIEYRNGFWLGDADFWSRLDADLCFDPFLCEYIEFSQSMRCQHPSPTQLPILPENMSYYRSPQIDNSPVITAYSMPNEPAQVVASAIIVDQCHGFSHLSNWPVRFGYMHSSNNNGKSVSILHNAK